MSFEKAFQIQQNNTLKQIEFKQKGTMAQDETWKHEELDSEGNIIAIYESWHCTSIKPPFKSKSGFKKYDSEGNIIQTSNHLDV